MQLELKVGGDAEVSIAAPNRPEQVLILVGARGANLAISRDYFGGAENGALFIMSGVIPAILGGLLYGWWVYGRGKESSHASQTSD